MKTLAVVISTLIIFAGLCNLVSADCSDYPGAIFCEDFNQAPPGTPCSSPDTNYGFEGGVFGYSDNRIYPEHDSTGGIGGSGASKIPIFGLTGDQVNFEIHWGTNAIYGLSSYYARGCWKPDSTFPIEGENWKLSYNYYTGGTFVTWMRATNYLSYQPAVFDPGSEDFFKTEDVPTWHLSNYRDQWTCIEWYVDSDIIQMWLSTENSDYDDTLYIDTISVTGPPFITFKIGSYWDGPEFENEYFWLDEVVISNSKIGPPAEWASAPCGEGAITSSCLCEGEARDTGFCCQDIWFDPFYVDSHTNVCGSNFLYVDMNHPNCDDGTSRAGNSESNPWCTLGRAAWGSNDPYSHNPSEAAQSGDVVLIMEGVYDDSSGHNERSPVYNPANSGSAGAPITFKAIGTVELTTSGSTNSPVIGSSGRSYIKWDGFTIRQDHINYRGGNGIIQVWGDYTTISNCDIMGIFTDYGMDDQHNAILAQGAEDGADRRGLVIENNRLHGFTGTSGRNDAAITMYWMGDAIIRHNEIYDSSTGIYAKSSNWDSIQVLIHNNIFRDIGGDCISMQSHSHWRVYQNIFKDSGSGYNWFPTIYQNGNDKPHDIYVVNNVIDNTAYAGTVFNCDTTCTYLNNNYFQNNLVTNSQNAIATESTSETGMQSQNVLYDFNMYNGYSTFITSDAGWTDTFADWQGAAYNYQDVNSYDGVDPLYVNEAGDDYRLSPSSPARNAGVDILDLDGDGSTTDSVNMGAYITGNEVIGPTDSYQPPPPQDPQCSDGQDNDLDGETDYPNDPGCSSDTDDNELGTAECDDGVDNDGDWFTDYRATGGDQGCMSLTDNDETNCGDTVCEGGETCMDCPGDCLQAGEACCSGVAYNPAAQVCCSGAVYTGNCCEDANCTGGDQCINHVCSSQTGTTVSVDSTYPGYTTDIIDDGVIDPYGMESTTWASGESFTEPHWVAIGFSSPQTINNVTIYWAYNFVMEAFMSSQEVWIQHWNGIDYENVSTITNTGYVEASSTSFDPITTAGLRLFQPPDSGPVGYSNILWLTEIDYSSSTHRADTNGDGCIDLQELLAFMVRWKVSSQDVPMPELMEAIGLWNAGTGCQGS